MPPAALATVAPPPEGLELQRRDFHPVTGAMPEVLKDAGVYFNPENPSSIAASLKLLLQDESLRENLGRKAQSLSKAFTWERCAQETFSLLSSVYKYHLL